MKTLITLLYFSLLLPVATAAQSKQKAEKDFVNQLNSILKNSSEHDHWLQTGTMTIDSAFAINKAGILSLTVRHTDDDSSFVRARMEAPINKIQRIAYDLYLILEYKTDEVTVFKSATNSNELIEDHKTNYLHIGAPWPEDMKHQEKLQKLLDKLLVFYKN
ncbi:hypothetical protein [Ferruginibacter sp.]|nr:hypothetical protein [Ferruginibacter sp.]